MAKFAGGVAHLSSDVLVVSAGGTHYLGDESGLYKNAGEPYNFDPNRLAPEGPASVAGITVPATGVYQVNCQLALVSSLSPSDFDNTRLHVFIQGSGGAGFEVATIAPGATDSLTVGGSLALRYRSGDVIDFGLSVEDGSDVNAYLAHGSIVRVG